ncbi:3-oxoacyl-[acyl-carrier-protein] synthase III [Streptomyces lucensis JCM 4490]|uniref:3-oxoacyl-[acyl-carrier-protein] synthase III n=1 Tax=Streptomyces lucensis JCM 4490 TaxID=1306176 RepID=A0A918JBD8_9ACTN|nr:3-oxoacyl-ACP synthase III family protein [Streptomyces lucensis]GGW70325.1 3-oxoacyl-[acyl-carrier-protein] synthase III [Streptomyces lucensis JCM 4490]
MRDAPDIYVRSAGTALPGPAVDNAALARRFGMPRAWEEWVETFVGTRRRHFAVDLATGDVRFSLADLAESAARRALTASRTEASGVDLVVMGTSSPDLLMPATVNTVADRLGIDGVATYQLQSGCAGAVQALDVAVQMLRTGRHRTALVLGADSCAKHLDVTMDAARLPPAEQINGALFGDGAGALVLSTEASAQAVAVRHVHNRLVGLGREPGQVIDWYGRADRDRERPPVAEDYKAIEESVPVLAAEAARAVLGALDWKETELDYLLPPQLSGRMTDRIVAHLGLDGAHEVSCIRDTGNTGNALPFFQLEQLLPRMVTGDRALAVAVESSKWIQAGFALEKV